jgi:carbon storage regulator CsrA
MGIVQFIQNKRKKRRSLLVLTRKPQQQIMIGHGDNVVIITVQRVHGSQVVLGIEADEDLPVNRSEIYEKIMIENGLYTPE